VEIQVVARLVALTDRAVGKRTWQRSPARKTKQRHRDDLDQAVLAKRIVDFRKAFFSGAGCIGGQFPTGRLRICDQHCLKPVIDCIVALA